MSDLVRIGKYLSVEKLPRFKGWKTDRWRIWNNSGDDLGTVSWDTGWRQYTYEPEWSFYNHQCLTDIAKFLNDENKKRKVKK